MQDPLVTLLGDLAPAGADWGVMNWQSPAMEQTLARLGKETLPAGEVVARKLTRSPRREFDRKVEIWLAPSLSHLPVRLRITEQNGDFVDMKLDELPVLPTVH